MKVKVDLGWTQGGIAVRKLVGTVEVDVAALVEELTSAQMNALPGITGKLMELYKAVNDE